MYSDGIDPIQLMPPEMVKDQAAVEETKASTEEEVRPLTRPVEQEQQQQKVEESEESIPLTREDIEEILHVLNESAKLFDISLRFSLEEELKRVIVTVFDKTSEEVIRQVPPEEVVQLAKRLTEMVGVLFNETA